MIRSILLCAFLGFSLNALADAPAPAASTATPPAQASTAAQPAPAAVAAAPAKPKLVCEVTHPLDSHINQRICMTPEEMAERKKHDQEALRRMQAGSPCATSSTGGC